MEDDYCSREAAKHAKKTIDETQTLYGNGNLPLPWRAWRLGENKDLIGVLDGLARTKVSCLFGFLACLVAWRE